MTDRRQKAYSVRIEAAELARSRNHAKHEANGDEQQFAGDLYFMSFTKGLPHNPATGLLADANDFVQFRRTIDDGFIDPFTERVRHGALYKASESGTVTPTCPAAKGEEDPAAKRRQWEAPTTATTFDLEGPDAQSVTMAPPPSLLGADGKVNPELVFEMAEVYELAGLRDEPFTNFETTAGKGKVVDAIARLNGLDYAKGFSGRPRKTDEDGKLDGQTVFRGSSPGVEVGPYLSQFMLIGTEDRNGAGEVKDGIINYGVLHIDQKVPVALKTNSYMRSMDDFVEVQRGFTVDKNREAFDATGDKGRPARRFISRPRDIATYVHNDALYEAYLNACIILLEMKAPFDPGFDHLSGGGAGAGHRDTRRNAGGFALYGGPHILTLVTEVATRGLKAVRFEKFNNHVRIRPEALAARVELARRYDTLSDTAKATVPKALKSLMDNFKSMLEANAPEGGLSTLGAIAASAVLPPDATDEQKRHLDPGSYFLPMAFPEGSPMHPSYGAGHATVAGACVTILKAFFDTSAVLAKCVTTKKDGKTETKVAFMRREDCKAKEGEEVTVTPVKYRSDENGSCLEEDTTGEYLTLEGELNKLAANISIARNMAGVHYFADYYDSLRMGEEVAIGILEEQALTYSTDPFVLSVPTFDGKVRRIGRR